MDIGESFKSSCQRLTHILLAFKSRTPGLAPSGHFQHTVVSEKAHDAIEIMCVKGVTKPLKVLTDIWHRILPATWYFSHVVTIATRAQQCTSRLDRDADNPPGRRRLRPTSASPTSPPRSRAAEAIGVPINFYHDCQKISRKTNCSGTPVGQSPASRAERFPETLAAATGRADNVNSPGGSGIMLVMLVRQWKLIALVIGCVVLSGPRVLAEAGLYETMMKERMLNNIRSSPGWKSIPDGIKVRYSACFAASLAAGLTMDEVRRMNAAAQGLHLDEELAQKALDQLMDTIDKLNRRDLSVLEKVCPNDMADFKKAGL